MSTQAVEFPSPEAFRGGLDVALSPCSGSHGGLSRSNRFCASSWLFTGECPPCAAVTAGAPGPGQPPSPAAGQGSFLLGRWRGRVREGCGTRGAAPGGGGAVWRRHRKAEGAAGGGRGAGGGHGRPGLPALQDHQVPQPLPEADGERLRAHAVSGAGPRGAERARSGAPAARRGLGKGSLPGPVRGWGRHRLRQTRAAFAGRLLPLFPSQEGPCQPGLGPV